MGGTTKNKFIIDGHGCTQIVCDNDRFSDPSVFICVTGCTKKFSAFLRLCGLFTLLAVSTFAQAPSVEKIDPPSWWTGSTINPVRILIRGRNLTGARIESATPGITASNFEVSANGHYLFADVRIAENVKVGEYDLRVVTRAGTTTAKFGVFQPQPRLGNYNGFLPDDVIYFVFTDRFADGDPANNDPAKSKGLYDRKKGRHYHGGDLQGIIDKFQGK